MGCPSLVTNVDALPHVIDSLNSIGCVCNKSTQDIAQAISRLSFLDKTYREELINVAKANYFFNF